MITSSCELIKVRNGGYDLQGWGIGTGPYSQYASKEFTENLEQGNEYLGRAINIFWTNLTDFAMNQVTPIYEIAQYGSAHFDALKLIKQGVTSVSWPKSVPIIVKHDVDISSGAGRIGHISLHKCGLDKQTYGFLYQWKKILETKPSEAVPQDMLDKANVMMKAAAMHMPVDIYRLKESKDCERQLWLKSFQCTETISKNAEDFEFSAWDICVQYTNIHTITKQMTGDTSTDSTEQWLAEHVDFATRSEYKCAKGSKSASNAILCKNKLTDAGVVWIVQSAKGEFMNSGPFCQMSKLLKICQRCGDDHVKLAWLVKLIYARLKYGCVKNDIAKIDLDKLISVSFEFYSVARAIPETFTSISAEKDGQWLKNGVEDPFYLFTVFMEPSEKQKVTTLRGSTKFILKFLDASYKAEYDPIYTEMITNTKKQPGTMKVAYANLNLKTTVDNMIIKEELEIKRAKVAEEVSLTVLPSPQDDDLSDGDEAAEEARKEMEAKSKEEQISSALTSHCSGIIDDTFVAIDRPITPEQFEAFAQTNDFVQHRHDTPGVCLWHLDPGMDRDSVPGQTQSHMNANVLLDGPMAESFIASMENHCMDGVYDVFCGSDAKHPPNGSQLAKLCKKTNVNRDDYYIQFKQEAIVRAHGKGAGRTKQKTRQRVFFTCAKPIPLNAANRLYYVLSDCLSDSIIQADVQDNPVKVTRAQKEGIVGVAGLSGPEQLMEGDKQVVLFHHDLDPRVTEEILQQACATKVISATPGILSLSVAILRRDATALLMFRSSTHQEVWRSHLMEWLRLECATNSRFKYYFPRSEVIRRLRLESDAPILSVEGQHEGGDWQEVAAGVSEAPHDFDPEEPQDVIDHQMANSDAAEEPEYDPMADLFGGENDALTEEPPAARPTVTRKRKAKAKAAPLGGAPPTQRRGKKRGAQNLAEAA